MPWCLFVLACEKFPCLGHIIAEQVTFERNAGLEGDKRRKTSSRVLAGLASIANYGSFHSTKIPVLISKVPRAQWNSIFRLHIPDASHRAFGYCSRNGCKSGTGDSNCVKFGPTYRNDQTSQSGPSSKVVPNNPVGPNRNGPFDLISNRNFRNFGLSGKRPIFVAEEGSEDM